MKGPQIDGLSKESLKKLYVDDPEASLTSVGEILGCNRETVRKWVKRHGLPVKKKHRNKPRKPENKKLADKKWLEGELSSKPVKQIARELGATEFAVWYWTRNHGLSDTSQSHSEAVKKGLKKRFPNGRFGEDHPRWKGGRRIAGGYIFVRVDDHPNARNGYIQEHRLVMEKTLGRYLNSDEVVHHKDGDKKNNHPDNLEVKKRGDHVSEHFEASHEVLTMREELATAQAKIVELEAEIAVLKGSKDE